MACKEVYDELEQCEKAYKSREGKERGYVTTLRAKCEMVRD